MPAVAGLFLVVGGYLTYLYNARNEAKRTARDQRAVWDEDVLDKGAALLAAGDEIHRLGLLMLPRTTAAGLKLLAAEGMPAINELNDNYRRFMLVMPNSIQKPTQDYMSRSLVILVPPFQREGQEHALKRHADAAAEFVSALRSLRRLEPLTRKERDNRSTSSMANAALETMMEEIRRENQENESTSASNPVRDADDETSPNTKSAP